MKIKQYILPLIILAAIFLAGRFTASDNSDELKDNWKQERKLLMEGIIKKQTDLTRLQADSIAVRKQMTLDSLRFSRALEVNQRAYTALKRKYNEINLNRADAHVLDSLVAGLYAEWFYLLPAHFQSQASRIWRNETSSSGRIITHVAKKSGIARIRKNRLI